MTAEQMSTRRLTPARIVALAVIVVLATGLVVLRVSPHGTSVTVPSGARAGQLRLHSCTFQTEAGEHTADCGTLVVPENRSNSHSRLIALPVIRVRASAADPGLPVFKLQGGPGGTNMTFPQASWFADKHDVVLVGYRGVDGSSVLSCPEVESALKHSRDLLAASSYRAYGNGLRSCASRLTHDGVDLSGYSITQQVEDMEAARVALGYHQIDLVSESAGTRTALIYAWRHPTSIFRSVMVGVNPPGNFRWDPTVTDEQINRYSQLCARDTSCRARTHDLAASLRHTAAHMPEHWWFFPIKTGSARVVSFNGLFESTSKVSPNNAPMTLDAWLSAAQGDSSGLWFASVAADLLFPKLSVWGEYAAIGAGADGPAVQAFYAAGGDHGSILGDPGTDFAWGGGVLAKAWPASRDDAQYSTVRTSNVDTLLVGGTLDVSTPPQIATRQLLPYLPNGHQVLLAGFGHTESFWREQTAAGNRLVEAYFDTGRVDSSLYKPYRIDFSPGVTDTVIAKTVATALIGLAALTVLSLIWMALHVRRRGRFGPKAAATLRSVFAVVLGLGGWCLGALVVLAMFTTVTLDNELVTLLSVGLTVGLATWLPRVQRDSDRRTKLEQLAAATGGSLLGASLGFNTAGVPLAWLTSVAAAVGAANLSLILLDMARAGVAGHRLDVDTTTVGRQPARTGTRATP